MGLGIVVGYSNQRGEPQWSAPPDSAWDYTIFGHDRPVAAPDERLELAFEKVPGVRGGYNRWTINGKSWPATNPLSHALSFQDELDVCMAVLTRAVPSREW